MKVGEMITLLMGYNPTAKIEIIDDCKENKTSKIYGFHLISADVEAVHKYNEKLASGENVQDYAPCNFVGIIHENTKNQY